ncbi:hypothetical protein LCGC14_2381530 [marine sediment metagenome]|uniref:Uncharacterized protein n=1 Tax=marine sediment metagenome TaxID=412755 RepID=A0A0F9EVJ1_9ZZZZ
MRKLKAHQKKQRCRAHRQERLDYWFGRLIDGTAIPDQVTLRYNKLKQVSK